MATRVSERLWHAVTDIVVFVSAAYFAYVGAFIYYFHAPYSTNPSGERYCFGPRFVTAQVCNDWQAVGSHTRLLFTLGFLVAFVVLALIARTFVWALLVIPVVTIQFVNVDRVVWLVSLGVAFVTAALVVLIGNLSKRLSYRQVRWAPVLALLAMTTGAGVLSAFNEGLPVPSLKTESALSIFPSVELSSIACTTADVCQAVGTMEDSGPDVVLSLRADHWTANVLPGSSGDVGPAISCSKPGNCLVAGAYSLFIEHDGRWSRNLRASNSTTYPSQGPATSACSPRGPCWAVDYSSSVRGDVVVGNDDGRWLPTHVEEVTTKEGKTAPVFVEAISCWSARSCTFYETASVANESGNESMYEQTETNGTWSMARAISPIGLSIASPLWINPFTRGPFACFSADDCWLGGSTNPIGSRSKSVVLHATAHGWTADLVGSPRTHSRVSTVEVLACGSPTVCVASGGTTADGSASQYFQAEVNGAWHRPLVEAIKNQGVGLASEPAGTRAIEAACSSTTTCYVVGTMDATNGPQIGFVARYERAQWTFDPLALHEGENFTTIQDISCAQSTCWAVGFAESNRWSRGFIFRLGPAPRKS